AADLLADCEQQLKAHGALRDYSRIPGGQPPAPRRRLGRWAWAVAPVVLLLCLGAFWLLPAAERYVANAAEVGFASDADVLGYDLLPGVPGDPKGMRPVENELGSALRLNPGAYQIKAKCKPGRVVDHWVVTTHGLFTNRTQEQRGETLLLSLGRGDLVSV